MGFRINFGFNSMLDADGIFWIREQAKIIQIINGLEL